MSVERQAEQSSERKAEAYVAGKERWFSDAYRRAWDWADGSGWRP
jgi:dephospho-CoA kinase